MKIVRDGREVGLGALLTRMLGEADLLHPGKTALYVVGLYEERGLALAAAVHRLAPSRPDPAELRARAMEMGAAEPLLAGAARIDILARALESLGRTEPPDRALLAWTLREVHGHGGVPVVLLLDGMVLVSTLDVLTSTDDDDAELWAWEWPPPVIEA